MDGMKCVRTYIGIGEIHIMYEFISIYEEVFRNISKLGTKVHYEFHFPALLSITLPNSNFLLIRDQKGACALGSISHILLFFPVHVWMLQSTSDSIASESMSIISSDRGDNLISRLPRGWDNDDWSWMMLMSSCLAKLSELIRKYFSSNVSSLSVWVI